MCNRLTAYIVDGLNQFRTSKFVKNSKEKIYLKNTKKGDFFRFLLLYLFFALLTFFEYFLNKASNLIK